MQDGKCENVKKLYIYTHIDKIRAPVTFKLTIGKLEKNKLKVPFIREVGFETR